MYCLKKQKIFITVTAILLLAVIFLKPAFFADGIKRGLSYCSQIIIPSLFPFMVASSLAAYGDVPHFAKKLCKKVSHILFRLPSEAITAVFLGIIGGYPSGAKAVNSLLSSGKISESQAKKLVLFCINSGAGFAVNAVGSAMLNSRECGKIIFFSGCAASIILGIAASLLPEKASPVLTLTHTDTPFSKAVVDSVTSSACNMLSICGFVCIFSAISEIVISFNINETLKTVIVCLLEVTSGCSFAVTRVSLPVLCAVISFGGICVHLQIFSLCKDFRPDIGLFYLFRILHAVLSALICGTILHFHPVPSEVFLSFSKNAAPFSFSAPSAISLLFLSALLILDLDTEKKIC